MAYLTNQIDTNLFCSIEGAIFYRQEQLEVQNRPGVDGALIRRLGAHGIPFELTTKSYHASYTAARNALAAFDDYPGTAPVTLTRNGVSHGDYYVLSVYEVRTIPVVNPTGHVVPDANATVCLIAKWKLLG